MNYLVDTLEKIDSINNISLNKKFIDIAGDIVTGLLLSVIVDSNKDGLKTIIRKRCDWAKFCKMSLKQFDRSIKILESKNIVTTRLRKVDGLPLKCVTLQINELKKLL
jgi:hypothetical protein